jgi:hypothetical protein
MFFSPYFATSSALKSGTPASTTPEFNNSGAFATSTPIPTLPTEIIPQIVIWIHGTRTHAIFPPTHVGITQNKITISLDKNNPYSPLGIHSLLSINQDLHVAAIGHAIHESNPELYLPDHIYLFGWSGEFTPEGRAAAGELLLKELGELVEKYESRYGSCPPITVITHSHGGNVALEAGLLFDAQDNNQDLEQANATLQPAQKNIINKNIIIDKLVLLACPVQKKTRPASSSRLFNTIYSIHSHKDYFQILDVQGLHPVRDAVKNAVTKLSFEPIKHAWQKHHDNTLFSGRHFNTQINLKQACVEWKPTTEKWSKKDLCIVEPFFQEVHIKKLQSKLQQYDQRKRGLMHIEFLFPTFLHKLPAIIALLDSTDMPQDPQNPSIVLEI